MDFQAECVSCAGTGVYRGFAEPLGVAVVCLHCGGTGCKKVSYTPFAGRKIRKGVNTVQRSGGTFMATGVGPRGNAVSYADFLQGKMPE